jgi:rfaE bifunctional protein nucleotidyltransferase chain/domain
MRGKILTKTTLQRRLSALRGSGRTIVFTNGCFDILHVGHVRFLKRARRLGDTLVVGLNRDRSVRRLGKGSNRPVHRQEDRAEVLASLEMVDFVTIFNEDTPLKLIAAIRPEVLVKGGDWSVERIVGADLVRARGGKVRSLPFVAGYSTSRTLQKMSKQEG